MANNTLNLSALIGIATFSMVQPTIAEEAFATRNLNIRSGPGISFEVVDVLIKNQPIQKRNCDPEGAWCYINHDGSDGWVASVFLTESLTPEPLLQEPTSIPQDSGDYIATAGVNVRTGPGTQFAVVDTLELNDIVTRGQCSSSGRWCYVDHDGTDGWVSNRFLSPIAIPEPEVDNQQPDVNFAPLPFVAKSSINIRSGPGVAFNILARLTKDEHITRNQCLPNGEWCYITHNGPDGWVSSEFIYPLSEHQANQTVVPVEPTIKLRMATVISGMPVRNAPSLLTGTLGRIERGTVVTVNECSSDNYWCHITSDTAQGWVPAAFLRTISEAVEPQPEKKQSSKEAMTNKRVLVREGPGLDFEVVGTVPAGRSLKVERCNTEGNWCLITRNGRSGWITTSNLTAPKTATPPAIQPTTPKASNTLCFQGFEDIRICLD